MERKEYEAPKVTRIEIGFEDRIIVAMCTFSPDPMDCSLNTSLNS